MSWMPNNHRKNDCYLGKWELLRNYQASDAIWWSENLKTASHDYGIYELLMEVEEEYIGRFCNMFWCASFQCPWFPEFSRYRIPKHYLSKEHCCGRVKRQWVKEALFNVNAGINALHLFVMFKMLLALFDKVSDLFGIILRINGIRRLNNNLNRFLIIFSAK